MDAAVSMTDLLDISSSRWPDRPILRYGGDVVTYRQFAATVARTAAGLRRIGVGAGDRVAVWLRNCPEWLVLEFAIARVGGSVVAVNTRLRREDVAFVLRHSTASVLVIGPAHKSVDFAALLLEIAPDWQAGSRALPDLRSVITVGDAELPGAVRYESLLDAPPDSVMPAPLEEQVETEVALLYTSGTTSLPRAAVRLNRNLFPHVAHVAERLEMREDDVVLWGFPFCGTSGQVVALATIAAGGCGLPVELGPPEETYDLMVRAGCTFLPAADVTLHALARVAAQRGNALRLRAGLSAMIGSETGDTTIRAMQETFGAPFVQPYGMTEVNAVAACAALSDPVEERARIGGPPVAPVELEVLTDSGAASADGTTMGEIVVKGPTVLPGYFRPRDGDSAVTDDRGWFHTGDLGERVGNRTYFTARLKDMLKIDGFNVSPLEIEGVLMAHPAVELAQVVAHRETGRGEVAVGFVRLRRGHDVSEDALREHCAARVARFKVPTRVFFLDVFPVAEGTTADKIQRNVLRQLAASLINEC